MQYFAWESTAELVAAMGMGVRPTRVIPNVQVVCC